MRILDIKMLIDVVAVVSSITNHHFKFQGKEQLTADHLIYVIF